MNSKHFNFIILIIGISLLGVGYLFHVRMNNQLSSTAPIATLTAKLDPVFVLKSPEFKKIQLQTNASIEINQYDQIEVGVEGLAQLEFKSQDHLKILEKSILSFSQDKSLISINIKSGDIEIDNISEESPLIIAEANSRKPIRTYFNEQQLLLTQKQNSSSENIPKKSTENSLTQDQIQELLKPSKSNFFRCYTQLLQKTPGLSGGVIITFTILQNGKIKNPTITSSTIKDPVFQKCLIESIYRVEFPPFNGYEILTSYPIKFE